MASKVEKEVEVKSSADKFFAALVGSSSLFPKIFPAQYKSIEIVEGDGKGVGTVRLVSYVDGFSIAKTSREKTEVMDEGNMTISYSVIEGELLGFYKPFKVTVKVVAKGEGAVVKTFLEFDKVSGEVPDPDLIQDMTAQTFTELDAYLVKN